jgi:predicted DNA-binding transcriptional regulator AlpA
MTNDTTRTDAWARARKIAQQWQQEKAEMAERYADHCETAALLARFRDATPPEIISMWESGTNEHGKPLTEFEGYALVEAWCGAFGEPPPSASESNGPSDAEPDEPDALDPDAIRDDQMLSTSDVLRMTGWSLTTFKRRRAVGAFPEPYQLGPRRIGWPMKEVRAVIEEMKAARYCKR